MTSHAALDRFSAVLLTTIPVLLSACGGANGETIEDVGEAQSALVIGPAGHALDYTACAQDFGTCAVDQDRYLAYGANGKFLYRRSGDPVSNTISCTPAFFGGDPVPGVLKTCYIANYTFQAAEGAVTSSFNRNIAYGANGVFNFATFNGSFTCNNATFGDPLPGVTKACYFALPGYSFGASEGGTLTGLVKTPVAYGANGKFLYQIASGSLNCGVAGFGSDPIFGVVKTCYKIAVPFIVDEGATIRASGTFSYFYGSGLNGNFLLAAVPNGGSCTNATFGGDPHAGAVKHCY